MPFGITSAQEVFHKRIHEAFEDIEGVETDIDDILVWGKNTKEHDERLRKVLNRCRKINLTLNEKKMSFQQKGNYLSWTQANPGWSSTRQRKSKSHHGKATTRRQIRSGKTLRHRELHGKIHTQPINDFRTHQKTTELRQPVCMGARASKSL
ncbi:transposon ty3-i Gag-Pol polyprotein [Plakobranchus ocellatus]|uniref:Transposon ty3-i Gag-Pol polyprotein n=1 Tax=Plakobranchus ocellatus TaxID=259542 RepID=A0AAV4CWA3_9GAST|nr:transposon ty3-i Gag-Pol polyprotein [Plakobranchus ocellatus]